DATSIAGEERPETWPLPGAKVEVKWDGVWWPCEVLDVDHDANLCTARYDDGRDEEPGVDVCTRVRKQQPAWVRAGLPVQVNQGGEWHESEVVEVNVNGRSCSIRYCDREEEEDDVDVASRVRSPQHVWLGEGMLVEVLREGVWCECEVLELSEGGSRCAVRYYDNDEEESGVDVEARARAPATPLYCLYVGQWCRGVVKSISREGDVLVDVGAECDGLLRSSRIPTRSGLVPGVRGLLDLDLEVDVWICGVDVGRSRLELTMVDSWVGGGFDGNAPPGFERFRRYLLRKEGSDEKFLQLT
ncbi:unnamed protein product, partial [Polarella glacialis]